MAARVQLVLTLIYVYFALFSLNIHTRYEWNGSKGLLQRDFDGLFDDGYPTWSYLQFIRFQVNYTRENWFIYINNIPSRV